MLAKLVLALALVAAPAAARDRHLHVVVVPLAERLARLAPGDAIDATIDQWRDGSGRNALDVAFGPADQDEGGVAVWRADGEGRDGSMRRAGLDRIVARRTDAGVVVTASAAGVSYASR